MKAELIFTIEMQERDNKSPLTVCKFEGDRMEMDLNEGRIVYNALCEYLSCGKASTEDKRTASRMLDEIDRAKREAHEKSEIMMKETRKRYMKESERGTGV